MAASRRRHVRQPPPRAAWDEAPKEQSFDFEADTLSAEYLKPNVDMLEGLRRGRRSSLISVRLNFVAEIVKSADDI